MEFIRHLGELQCAGCSKIEEKRNIYYTQDGKKQIYWFVCGPCGEWTKVSFGCEERGALAPDIRRRNIKMKRFDERNEVIQYGTNWQ